MSRRPSPPASIKDIVWAREGGICEGCRKPIADRSQAQYDHRPALWSRERVPGLPPHDPASYIPHANDPAKISLVHSKPKTGLDCHDVRTFGDGLNRGDVSNAAKTERVTAKQEEFRRAMLAKAGGLNREPEGAANSPRRGGSWPKGRKIQSRNNLRREKMNVE